MMTNQKAAVVGAFVADALSLGVHWVYNTGVIDKKFGRVDRYYDPLTSYHKGKRAGDFTHYGDQMLVLLESLSGADAIRRGPFCRFMAGVLFELLTAISTRPPKQRWKT